jgi:hypothetical protein
MTDTSNPFCKTKLIKKKISISLTIDLKIVC